MFLSFRQTLSSLQKDAKIKPSELAIVLLEFQNDYVKRGRSCAVLTTDWWGRRCIT